MTNQSSIRKILTNHHPERFWTVTTQKHDWPIINQKNTDQSPVRNITDQSPLRKLVTFRTVCKVWPNKIHLKCYNENFCHCSIQLWLRTDEPSRSRPEASNPERLWTWSWISRRARPNSSTSRRTSTDSNSSKGSCSRLRLEVSSVCRARRGEGGVTTGGHLQTQKMWCSKLEPELVHCIYGEWISI